MKLNKDIKKRDELIFGEFDREKYMGGLRNYRFMKVDLLKQLVEQGFADPETCQNDSPSIQEFIDFLEENEGYTVFGYVISDTRPDYRVSIEGLQKDEPTETKEEIKKFFEFANGASELDIDGYAWWD